MGRRLAPTTIYVDFTSGLWEITLVRRSGARSPALLYTVCVCVWEVCVCVGCVCVCGFVCVCGCGISCHHFQAAAN